MVLQFKFKYLSNNGTLLKFLDSCAKKFDCEYKILQENEFIVLYIKGELEVLELFSTKLSSYLPMSIYFYDSEIDMVDEFPFGKNLEIKDDFVLPFCSDCLNKVEDDESSYYYNAFKSCSNCGSEIDTKNFILTSDDTKEICKSNEELFSKIARFINDGKKIKIKTFRGVFVFSKFDVTNDKSDILATNLDNIPKMFVIKKSETIALASIEKPIINLKLNEIFKVNNECNFKDLNVRFANDFILYLLCLELEKLSIDFISYNNSNVYDYCLDFESSDFKLIDIPKIKVLQNERKIILSSSSYCSSLENIYNKFEDKNKGQLMVLLSENNLLDKSIVNFYLSSKYDNNIALYSKEYKGFIDILNVKLPNNMQSLFNELKTDETGNTLLNNYKKKFPDVYEKALNYDITKLNIHSFSSLFSIAEAILGFENTIINNASEALIPKGPRIDYKLFTSDKFYNKEFDITRFFRSAISFKLAGVDEITISLGYVESLAHFIANIVDTTNNELSLDGVSLCGDMFENDLFSNLVHKSITKNFKTYYNKDFVLQGA